jgi:NAD(P)H-flavin reductase
LRWATPPPLGRVLLILAYFAVVIYMMTWRAIVNDIYFFERIGYRNAWISITQLPMLYLLSMKVNVVGYLTGIGHERLNWLHRWVARIMLITATVHGFHFWVQWDKAEFTEYALQIMPLTKYGFGAWGILLWNVIVGFVPIRRLAYEVWLVQHIVSAILMLWLLYRHIPITARYNLWMAISFLVFDRAARWFILLWQNIRLRPNRSTCQGGKYIGHHISARAVGPLTTVLTVKDVHFHWKAGQHVYLWIPRLGPIEAHPYTIACAHRLKSGGECNCNSIQLIIRAHKGFSKRLHSFASKHPEKNVTGFLSGPFGAPPKWDMYETIVLIGASTGASFTVPMLEDMAARQTPTCVKKVEFALMAKTAKEVEYYLERVRNAARTVREKGIDVRVHVAITGEGRAGQAEAGSATQVVSGQDSEKKLPLSSSPSSRSSDDSDAIKPAPRPGCHGAAAGTCACCMRKPAESGDSSSLLSNDKPGSVVTPGFIREYTSRPDVEALIREPVEAAWGETAVIVCGGKEVVARTRNCVSRLSDERAVHKGTGAQGIYLYVEEYSF